MLNILKHLVSVSQAGLSGDMLEDFFPQRIDSNDEFDQFNERLGNLEFRKKMVSSYVSYNISVVCLSEVNNAVQSTGMMCR